MARLPRLFRLIGSIFDAFTNWISDAIPKESQLTTVAQQMYDELDLRANATSLKMALADQKREELARELANHEALDREARDFFRQGKKLEERRCVTLKLRSAKQIEKLKKEYERLQLEAERASGEFLVKKTAVEEKISQIPRIQQDARLIRMQEKIENLSGRFDLESGERLFDETAEELRIKKLQLENRAILTSDPNIELDRSIRTSIEEKEIEKAIKELEHQELAESAIEAEFTPVVTEDSISSAHKLLEAPRYQGLFSEANRKKEEKFVVLKKGSGGW